LHGKFAQFDPEGDGSERVGDLDPPIARCSGRSALLSVLVNSLEGFDAGLCEVDKFDPDLVRNDIVSIHEMEIVALHHGGLDLLSGMALGGVSHSPPRA
jgi:hypothetical protein